MKANQKSLMRDERGESDVARLVAAVGIIIICIGVGLWLISFFGEQFGVSSPISRAMFILLGVILIIGVVVAFLAKSKH